MEGESSSPRSHRCPKARLEASPPAKSVDHSDEPVRWVMASRDLKILTVALEVVHEAVQLMAQGGKTETVVITNAPTEPPRAEEAVEYVDRASRLGIPELGGLDLGLRVTSKDQVTKHVLTFEELDMVLLGLTFTRQTMLYKKMGDDYL